MGKMKLNNHGEMGVGTMVVFIAMVLVAAVAASVLISTANTVREQATQTGSDAVQGVSTGMDIVSVTGDVANYTLTDLKLNMRLGAGSPSIDLGRVIVSVTVVSDGSSTSADIPCNSTNTAQDGDRIIMTIGGLSAEPGSQIFIKIMPSVGYATNLDLALPDVLFNGTISLR